MKLNQKYYISYYIFVAKKRNKKCKLSEQPKFNQKYYICEYISDDLK